MADNKNDPDSEFEDDFSDVDFEDTTLEDDNDFAELSPDDVEDDFESEEWQDEEDPAAGKKGKDKSLYTTGEKKGLSFNTMVIIGAVVVGGGVMMFTIMNKTAEQAAGQKSVFQSIMGMAGVMDGVLSGEKENTPTEEDMIAQEQKTQNEGFLNNPDSVTDATPPQPAPIAPSETDPLTPMPDMATETPRGPDEVPPTVPAPEQTVADGAEQVPVVPLVPEGATGDAATPAAPTESAEDILKKVMASRGQPKTDSPQPSEETVVAAAADTTTPPPESEDVPPPAIDTAPTAVTEPSPVSAIENLKQDAPVTTPSAPAPEAVTANTQAVEQLESKIDALLKRMDQIENDLGSVKEDKDSNYQQIEQTVASLKEDISAIKDRPAAAPKAERVKAAVPPEAEDTSSEAADEPKAAPAPKKIRKAAATSKPSTATGKWELRAAQPGRAWISKPGDRDMQSVEIGQTIAGIGTVNAITYQSGRWTVYGSQGQINQ